VVWNAIRGSVGGLISAVAQTYSRSGAVNAASEAVARRVLALARAELGKSGSADSKANAVVSGKITCHRPAGRHFSS